jgi:L-rhamnose mutarotase
MNRLFVVIMYCHGLELLSSSVALGALVARNPSAMKSHKTVRNHKATEYLAMPVRHNLMNAKVPAATSRLAFRMKLKPGCASIYKERHDAIWPELTSLLIEQGIHDYSIFLDEQTNVLFAVQKITGAGGSQDLGQNPIVKKWWAHMADIMETNPDNSPVSFPMKEVFRLD